MAAGRQRHDVVDFGGGVRAAWITELASEAVALEHVAPRANPGLSPSPPVVSAHARPPDAARLLAVWAHTAAPP